jgi:hemoglobin-like flavoprotein
MTPDQIALVRTTFADVLPAAPQAAEHFYARLFELDPALRPLFGGDIELQGHKLMSMLGTAVGLLERGDALGAALERLGQRHAGYGVEPGHYATVGRALLDTLAAGLGERFTPAAQAAWTALYGHVAATMQAAAAARPATASTTDATP